MPGVDQRWRDQLLLSRRWRDDEHAAAELAPHPSLRSSLVRRPAPPTCLLEDSEGVWVLTETTSWANAGATWVELPWETVVRLERHRGLERRIRLRCVPDTGDASVVITGDEGRTATVDVPRSGWADLLITGAGLHVTTSTGPIVIELRDVVELRTTGGEGRLLTRSDGAATPPTSTATIRRLVVAAVDRLDHGVPGWHGDDVHGGRLLHVGVLATPTRDAELPSRLSGEIELIGFASDTWLRRQESRQWVYFDTEGQPIDTVELDRYGRSGGLVAYVRGACPIEVAATSPGTLPALPRMLFEGPREHWVDARRNAETVLQQAAMAWYAAVQRGADAAAAADDSAVEVLLAALSDRWHPAFGWWIDVMEIVVRGMNRYRFSDDRYPERGAECVLAMIRHLGDRGITSMPVVVS